MEKPHDELHKFAKEAAIAFQRKDVRAAEEFLVKLEVSSAKVVEILNSLKSQL